MWHESPYSKYLKKNSLLIAVVAGSGSPVLTAAQNVILPVSMEEQETFK